MQLTGSEVLESLELLTQTRETEEFDHCDIETEVREEDRSSIPGNAEALEVFQLIPVQHVPEALQIGSEVRAGEILGDLLLHRLSERQPKQTATEHQICLSKVVNHRQNGRLLWFSKNRRLTW